MMRLWVAKIDVEGVNNGAMLDKTFLGRISRVHIVLLAVTSYNNSSQPTWGTIFDHSGVLYAAFGVARRLRKTSTTRKILARVYTIIRR
jgi:hypothetical protein